MDYKLSKKFPQKRAFITGAASGLGFALCEELAKDGWHIGMSDINQEALETAAEKVKQGGGKPIIYPLDVADKEQYRKVSAQFLSDFGGIDLLVNNAGVGDAGYIEEYSLENWEWLMGINLFGVINGCHLFVPTFKQQGSGHIINIASAAAYSSLPMMSAYNSSKAAVRSLTESIDAELNVHNVQVSVVMPTFFKTQVMQYSRGSKESIEMSKLIFATSPLTPDVVAKKVLRKAGRGRFHIILPFQAKFMFWLKRISPSLVLRLIRLSEKNKGTMQQGLQKKYARMEKKGKVDKAYLARVFDK